MGNNKKRPPSNKKTLPQASVLPSSIPLWLGPIFLIGAALVSAYLLNHALTRSPLGGCEPGSNCDRVLGSSWAYIVGLPASAVALIAYISLLFTSFLALSRRGTSKVDWAGIALAISVAIIGAAIWFIGLQAIVLKSWCKYCLTAHLLGVSGSIFIIRALAGGRLMGRWSRAIASGVLAVTLLVALQATFPKKMNTITVHNGSFTFVLNEVPVLGSVQAPKAIISLFDYTCPDCFHMHKRLAAALERFTNQLCVITFPVPLNSDCNALVRRTSPKHALACEYARLGLAVRKISPTAYQQYDHWIFNQPGLPPLEHAKTYADTLVGAEALSQALKDPWVAQTLQKGVDLYRANEQRTRSLRMPQLIIGDRINLGPLNSDAELFELISAGLGIQ